MIIRVSKLKGKKILTREGKKVETADDILYDPDQKRIVALQARKSGIFLDAKLLFLDQIQQFGKDAILVSSEDAVKKASEADSHIEKLVKDSKMNLSNNKLVGDDATEYGSISDVFFDTENGQVRGFEYSQGMIGQNKKTIKIEEITSVGPDAIVVRPVMVNKDGEVKPSSEPKESKSEQSVKPSKKKGAKSEHPSKESQKESQKTSQQQDQSHQDKQYKDTDLSSDEKKQIEDSIGKYATKNILLSTDEVLIRQNDILTHESLRVAYTYGVLDQVLQNASRKPID